MNRWSAIPPPGLLRTLAWATLANTVGTGLWLAGSALFLTRYVGLSVPSVGLGLTIAALVGLAASVPVGRLADRRDPRTLRAVLQLMQAAVAALYLLVDSFAVFVVIAVLDALLVSGNLAVRAALVAAVAGPQGRVRAFATLRAVANVGTSVGAALAGLALVADNRTAYQLLVIGNAGTYVLSAVLIMRLPALPPTPASVATPAAPTRGILGQAVRDVPFLAVSAASAVLSLHYVVLALILPLWVVSQTTAPAAVISAVLMTNTVLTVLLAVRMSHGAQTAVPAARTMRRAGLVLAAAMLLYAATGSLPTAPAITLLLVATTLFTIGDLWHAVGSAGLAYDLAGPNAVGEYQGVDGLLSGLARAAGPALLTLLILDSDSDGVGWVAVAALFAVTGLLAPRLTRWALLARPPVAPTPARPPDRPRLRRSPTVDARELE